MQRLRPWQVNLAAAHPDRRSRDIFSYPVFSYFAGGVRRHISGRTRIYLNEMQILRWNYFFRPNMRRINAVDKNHLSSLSAELQAIRHELDLVQSAPAIIGGLESAKARDGVLVTLAAGGGAVAGLFFLLIFASLVSAWPAALVPLAALIAVVVGLGLRRTGEIGDLEDRARRVSAALGCSIEDLPNLGARQSDIQNRAMMIQDQVGAILRFRNDIAAQRPQIVHGAKDMDAFLDDAFKRLEKREIERLNVHTEDDIIKFGPMVRWGFESSRKQMLGSLKPQINSIVRRDNHYALYEVQFLFVHRGQLTIYDGFYDLIQGEMMGETRKHVVIANIFSVQDEISQDFDFRPHVQEVISYERQIGEETGNEGEGAHGEENPPRQLEDEKLNRVSVTQTRTVRLLGNGPPVELKFMVADERDTWIAQLKQDRQREEEEIATIEAMMNQMDGDEEESESIKVLNEHEERLLRIREYEERVQRSETARDVERIITQILEFARHAAGRQQP